MLTAYGLSTIGDYFDYIALMILFGYTWKLSPVALALYPIMYALPGLVLGQFTGVIADKVNRAKIMMGCDIFRGVVTVLLIFAPNVFVAYPLLVLRGAAAVFNTPANQALTRQVVAEAHLLKATTYNRAVFQSTKILAPFLGGTLAALTSPQMCLAINAVSFVISAVILFDLRNTREAKGTTVAKNHKEPFFQMWRQGWLVLLSVPVLFRSTLFYLAGTIVVQIVESQYTVLFRDVAPDRAALRGWFTSSIGCGALLAVMTLNRTKHFKLPGVVLGGGILLQGMMCGMIGTFHGGMSSVWPLIGGFLGGAGSGLLSTGFTYLVQRETPKEVNGRVFGILSSLFSANMIVGPLGGGVLVTFLGPSYTFVGVGLVLAAIGGIGLMFGRYLGGNEAAMREGRSVGG
jgi:MFS family permease